MENIEWLKYPNTEGYWWRRVGPSLNITWVKFKEDINENEIPVMSGYYLELGDVMKQAIFEIDIPNVSWTKCIAPTIQ